MRFVKRGTNHVRFIFRITLFPRRGSFRLSEVGERGWARAKSSGKDGKACVVRLRNDIRGKRFSPITRYAFALGYLV